MSWESWEQHTREYVLGLEEALSIGHSVGAHFKEKRCTFNP